MYLAQRDALPAWNGIPGTGAATTAEDLAQNPALAWDIVTSVEDFLALEHDWNELFARSGRSQQMFQTFAWCRTWVETFLDRQAGVPSLAILTGREAGRLVMLWPLAVNRVAGLKEVAWLGEPVSQYGDILADPAYTGLPHLEAAWDEVRRQVRPSLARLNKTRADSVIAPLLAALGARVTQEQDAPFIDMSAACDWPDVEQRHFTPKSVKNRRRQTRRLAELGAVTFESHAAGPQAAALAAGAIAMKRAWLAEKGLLSPAISDDRTLRFFTGLCGNAELGRYVSASALKVNGENAAISIAFAAKGRHAAHVIVYAPKFEKAGAGAVLMEHTIREAYQNGIEVYDLLAPGGGYKHEWTEAAAPLADYALALTPAGHLYADAYLAALRPHLKAMAMNMSGLYRRWRGLWS